jgi:hypothetical protein
MKTSTRFLAAFAAAWLAGAAITAASIWEYSPEDFTLFDLAMFGSMIGLGGVDFVRRSGFQLRGQHAAKGWTSPDQRWL